MLYRIFKKMFIAKIDIKSKNELQKQSSNKFIKNSLNNKSDLNHQINKFSYVKKTLYQKYLNSDRIRNFVVESKIKFLIINIRNIFFTRKSFENSIYFFNKTIFLFLLLDNFNIQLENFETFRRLSTSKLFYYFENQLENTLIDLSIQCHFSISMIDSIFSQKINIISNLEILNIHVVSISRSSISFENVVKTYLFFSSIDHIFWFQR